MDTDDAPVRDHLLLPPPTVRVGEGEVVLWTWMRHQHPHPEGLAARVVHRFYDAAAGDPEVAAYFHGIDVPVLRAHFVRAFIGLADRGLTADDVRVLAERHESARDTAGRRITPEVFDRVVVALGGALHAEGVPMATIEQIARMCLPIRTAMTSAA
jgi:truncated hemoglobin YjbI